MHAKLGLLSMLATARFKEHIKAFKHTSHSLYKIEDYLGLKEEVGATASHLEPE